MSKSLAEVETAIIIGHLAQYILHNNAGFGKSTEGMCMMMQLRELHPDKNPTDIVDIFQSTLEAAIQIAHPNLKEVNRHDPQLN